VVKIEGLARNASISGEDIEIDRISGATVIAGRRVVVRMVEKDEADIMTEIKVGFKIFYQLKIDETNELVDYLKNKLEKMKDIFGDDIVNEITYTNSEIMFLKFALRAAKDPRYKNMALETFKQLLDFIPSSKSLIVEKNKEVENLKLTMQGNGVIPGQVIIKETVKAPVRIQIDSVDTELPAGEGGVFMLEGDKIVRRNE
jgi:D-Tyr-tRNAtyr deacylase